MSKEERVRIKEQEDILRRSAMRNARENFKKMKDLLQSKGYKIHKNPYSYTVRKDKLLGIEPPKKDRVRYNKSNKVLDIPYMRTLFTMAHEVGHILQWNDETDLKHKFDEFYTSAVNAEIDHGAGQRIDLEHIHKVWYELDAWVSGMQFIPQEYHNHYKQYAYNFYKTYMEKRPMYYFNDMLLRNMMIQLNADKHF